MSIALTDDHKALADTASELLAKRDARGDGTRPARGRRPRRCPAFWDEVAGLGWLGLHLPEEHGGSGFGLPELVVVVEQLGRAVDPGPVRAHRHRLGGDRRGGARRGAEAAPTRAGRRLRRRCGRPRRRGRRSPVAAASGTAGVVLRWRPGRPAARTRGRRRRRGRALGRRRVGRGAGQPGPGPPVGPGGLRRRAGRGRCPAPVGLLVDLVPPAPRRRGGRRRPGVHRAWPAAYAKEREQFGRPIAMYQAVKHHCANMLVAAELATCLVWDAARAAADGGDQFSLAAAMAATRRPSRGRRVRQPEHPGPRRHRLHLGARRPPLPAPSHGARLGASTSRPRRPRWST